MTGIDKQLIENFHDILRILSSTNEVINLDNFGILLTDTFKLYQELYAWCYMPVTVHKVLAHGRELIEFFAMPPSDLSEEALEALHKVVRFCREHHTRKSSRLFNMTDLMNMLLLSSDPLIACHRNAKRKPKIRHDKDDLRDLDKYFIEEDSFADSCIFLSELEDAESV